MCNSCVPYEPNTKLLLERDKLYDSINNRNTHTLKKKTTKKPKPKQTKNKTKKTNKPQNQTKTKTKKTPRTNHTKNAVVMKKNLMCNIRTCELKFWSELLSCITVALILFPMHKTKTIYICNT